jgi:vacuolar-type H+-ATPase subunit F/Vma7
MKVLVVTDELLGVGFRFSGYKVVDYEEFERMLDEPDELGEYGVIIMDSKAWEMFEDVVEWLRREKVVIKIPRPGESFEAEELRKMVKEVTGLDVLKGV